MLERIRLDINGTTKPVWVPLAYGELTLIEREAHREARVLACLMFGWEARSEGR